MSEDKVQIARNLLSEEKAKRFKEDITAVLKTPSGRRVFSTIFTELKLLGDVSDPNGNTQSQNIGKQKSAQWIYRLIMSNAGFDYMVQIWRDDMEEQRSDEQRLKHLLDKLNKEK
jgi:hypothetical protein